MYCKIKVFFSLLIHIKLWPFSAAIIKNNEWYVQIFHSVNCATTNCIHTRLKFKMESDARVVNERERKMLTWKLSDEGEK